MSTVEHEHQSKSIALILANAGLTAMKKDVSLGYAGLF